MEYHIDNTSMMFFGKLAGFAESGEPFDMAEWLQLYAFDAIGSLTVSRSNALAILAKISLILV